MAKLDADWLAEHGQTLRPLPSQRALYERLKLVAALLADAPQCDHLAVQLLWRDERGEVNALALPIDLVIGRAPSCGLVLASPRISRRHCQIKLLRGVAWVSDLGSANGTHLNGTPLSSPAPLRDGDLIEVGGEVLVFVG